MKKILSIIFILTFVFASISMADSTTATSLGNPTMLLKDTSIIGSYPAALQQFPNAVWAKITGVGTYDLGVAYMAGDMLGFLLYYSTSPVSASYTVLSGYFAGGSPYAVNLTQHLVTMYGGKLGNMLFGMRMINSFANATFSTKTIDSNTKEVRAATIWDGVQSSLSPSAILDMDQLKIYGTFDLDLNATKYYKMDSHKSNELKITPNLFKKIGIKALAAYELSDKTTAGLTFDASMNDTGYAVSTATNTVQEIKTNYVNVSYDIATTLGFAINPNDVVSLFVDLPFGVNFAPDARWKGDNADKKITTTWTIPTPAMGAQAKIGKIVKIRASATPTWTRTVTDIEDYKIISTPTGTRTVVDSYSVTTALGLGLRLGQFYLNAELLANTLTQTFTQPLSLISGLFTGAPTTLLGEVQVGVLF